MKQCFHKLFKILYTSFIIKMFMFKLSQVAKATKDYLFVLRVSNHNPFGEVYRPQLVNKI